jgi:UDP-N-acetylglucosamine 2-epimerase (non-hydrolysing)
MKVLIVLGTRPEIIRLSRVIKRLDRHCDLTLVHTGQNFDPSLSDVFFDELGVRAPDRYLGIEGDGFADRVGRILAGVDPVLTEFEPDRLLVLGDTDSGLSAYVAKRRGIPVFHMEAGNRCFDDRVPEEVNRRVIDHSSDVLMPYTNRSRDNLLREGIHQSRILVTGNPIKEVMDHHAERIGSSGALDDLGVKSGEYLLLTVHRQETVDVEERLGSLMQGAVEGATELGVPLVFSVHPPARRVRPEARRAGRPTVRAVRLFRLRRARAQRPVRAHGQRHRAGGVLHHGGADGDRAGHHRAAGDGGMRKQCAERGRAGGHPKMPGSDAR